MFEGKFLKGSIWEDKGWRPDGKQSETLITDGDGIIIDYYENGQVWLESHYHQGQLVYAKGWDPDGEPNETCVEQGEGVEAWILADGRKMLVAFEGGQETDAQPADIDYHYPSCLTSLIL